MLNGILFGLGAAVFQAVSYIFSRRFLTEHRASSRHLFALSHAQMGVMALVALPFVLPAHMPPAASFFWYLLGTAGFYLTGQWLLFLVLKTTDSSLVAPLLGFKIPVLALISALLLGAPPTAGGWCAVLLATGAGLLLAPPRGLPEVRVLLLMLLVCLAYSGSDLCIPRLVARLQGTTYPAPALEMRALILGVSLTYILCGVVGAAVLLHQRRGAGWQAQVYALPVSVTWVLAMCTLFAAFSLVGVILGNLLQAMRGPLSVALGWGVGRFGLPHLDTLHAGGRRLLLRRALGALLMLAAIILYMETR